MSEPSTVRRWLREPLVHFLLIGAVLFLAVSAAHAIRRPKVRIGAQELEQLASYWEMQTQRPPTREELAAIIRERVEEELLAREAVRLGLDRDDMIVRRRLAQKMAFASEDVASIPEPSEATLKAYYDTIKGRFAQPGRVAMRHIFLNHDRPGGDAPAAAAALAALKSGKTPPSDPSLLPLSYADVTIDDLSRDYGPTFAKAVADAPVGAWIGPVESPFGSHLIRVESRRPREIPPLADVRQDVRAAWIDERRKAANRAYIQRLWRRYDVKIDDLPSPGPAPSAKPRG